jgi:hypothetical protein
MEGSLVAYKVFTNGSVLQASEINDNLMRQSVMVFSNAAARTAAITSPIEGMLTWLEDVNRYESYNGTSWGSPFGLTHINTTTLSGVASVQVNNVFSSAYQNYMILGNFTSSPNPIQVRIRLSASGTPASGANYNVAGIQATTGVGPGLTGGANLTFGNFGVAAQDSGSFQAYVTTPFVTSRTGLTFHCQGSNSSETWHQSGSIGHTLSASYDGFEISNVGNNLTGTIRTYGVRN